MTALSRRVHYVVRTAGSDAVEVGVLGSFADGGERDLRLFLRDWKGGRLSIDARRRDDRQSCDRVARRCEPTKLHVLAAGALLRLRLRLRLRRWLDLRLWNDFRLRRCRSSRHPTALLRPLGVVPVAAVVLRRGDDDAESETNVHRTYLVDAARRADDRVAAARVASLPCERVCAFEPAAGAVVIEPRAVVPDNAPANGRPAGHLGRTAVLRHLCLRRGRKRQRGQDGCDDRDQRSQCPTPQRADETG
jgi:hypothetical protein